MKSRSFSRMAIAVAVSCAFVGCGDDSVPAAPDAAGLDAGPLVRLRGGVQKGPFILGSSLAISPIDGIGNPTGTVYNTMTFNDLGEFAVEFSYLGAVSLEATGYYYNEATGALSGAPLTLRAYHEVSSGGAQAAYLNIITHLTYGRIQQLVVGGSTLVAATAQAEGELRGELGIGPPGFAPEAPGIFLNLLGGDSDSNAYLLAVSAVLAQAGVTRGGDAGLQELLNIVSTDLGTDGSLGDALGAEIDTAQRVVNGDLVMEAFRARLVTLGSDAVVPNIHRMLDTDLDGIVNASDNCNTVANTTQANGDGDAWGDACDNDALWTTPVWTSAEADSTSSVAWGDVDEDGDLDLATGGLPNRVYRNDGGTLTANPVWGSTEPDASLSVAWADVDGDGDLDLAVGTPHRPARMYRNDGGTLTAAAAWSSTEADTDSYAASSVAWGDVDLDGDPDLAVGGVRNRLYRNDAGTLTAAAVWTCTETTTTQSVAWGDLDEDGDLDLATAGSNGPNHVYRNTGGTLTTMAVWTPTDAGPGDDNHSVAWGDVDGDGDLDLAVSAGGVPGMGGASRLYRNEAGALTARSVWSATAGTCVAWGDVDLDGDLDLAVGGQPNRLFRNDAGALTATGTWSAADATDTLSVAWGDVDGDGDLDLAAATRTGPRLYINTLR